MNWSLSTASKLEVDEHLNRKREQSHGKQKLLRYIESLRDTSFGESRIQFQLIRNSMSSECWWQLYKSWVVSSIIGLFHFCPTKVESNKNQEILPANDFLLQKHSILALWSAGKHHLLEKAGCSRDDGMTKVSRDISIFDLLWYCRLYFTREACSWSPVVIKGNLNQSWGLWSVGFRTTTFAWSKVDWVIGLEAEGSFLDWKGIHATQVLWIHFQNRHSFSRWWVMLKSWILILVVSSGMRHHNRGCTSDSQRNPRPLDEWWINENLVQHFHAEFSCSDLKHNSHRCNGSDGRARATSSTGHERYGRHWSTLALWSCSNPDGFHAQHILFNSIRFQH